MRETNITPDFGFDPDEQIVVGERREPWSYMSQVLLPRCRQRNLWLCIDEMNQIKRDYMSIMQQKQKGLHKNYKNREEIKKIFKTFQILTKNNEEPPEEDEMGQPLDTVTIGDDKSTNQMHTNMPITS